MLDKYTIFDMKEIHASQSNTAAGFADVFRVRYGGSGKMVDVYNYHGQGKERFFNPYDPETGAVSVYDAKAAGGFDVGFTLANAYIVGDAFEVTFDLYVYDLSGGGVRGLIIQGTDFVGLPATQSFFVTINASNMLEGSINDDGVIVSVVLPVRAGSWLPVKFSFDGTSITLLYDSVSAALVIVTPAVTLSATEVSLLGANSLGFMTGAMIRNVKMSYDGAPEMDCLCREGTGVACVNSAGNNGVISDAGLHRAPIIAR